MITKKMGRKAMLLCVDRIQQGETGIEEKILCIILLAMKIDVGTGQPTWSPLLKHPMCGKCHKSPNT